MNKSSESSNSNKWLALLLALLLHAGLFLVLLFSYLDYKYPPDDLAELEELPEEEILWGGEYVMLGDLPDAPDNSQPAPAEQSEVDASAPAEEATVLPDVKNTGEANDRPKEVVTQKAESPMKVVKKVEPKKEEPKPKGLTASEKAEQDRIKQKQAAEEAAKKAAADAAAKKAAAEAAAKSKISGQMSAFGKGTGGTGSGSAGSPNGNSTTGARSGKPGVGGLNGYTLASWGKPHSSKDGVIVIKVRVNARGKVTDASYQSGSGPASADNAVRNSCVAAAKQSSFSVPKGTTTDGVGTITWRFE